MKVEGRTQLVGYAMKHGLAKTMTEARKAPLETLRQQVEAHRSAAEEKPRGSSPGPQSRYQARYQARRHHSTCGAVYDSVVDCEIAWCGTAHRDASGTHVSGYDSAVRIADILNRPSYLYRVTQRKAAAL
jgi:hypothetical protein